MINVLMLSNNESLNYRLKDAFNEFMSDTISFKITTLDSLYQDVSTADLLLIDPKMPNLNSKNLPSSCAYAWFTEDNTSNLIGISHVYLYQSIMGIGKTLFNIQKSYSSGLISKAEFFQKTKIVLFCSCGGNTGATTLAETYSYTKSTIQGQSVLHIALSPFESSNNLVNIVNNVTHLEDISNPSNKSILENLELVNGFKSISSALEFNSNTMCDIVKELKKLEFDYIIFDYDINYINLLPTMIELSNDIFAITDGSISSINSLEVLYNYVLNLNSSFDRKFKVIHNYYTNNDIIHSSIYNQKLVATFEPLSNGFSLNDASKIMTSINL